MGCSSCGRNKFNAYKAARSNARKSSTGKRFRSVDLKAQRTAKLRRPIRKVR